MKETSVAPKERINIKFVPATGDQQSEVELPLKTVVLGDFTGRTDETPMEERQSIDIDKNNFADVLKEMNLVQEIEVKDTLREDDPDATLNLKLNIESMQDFAPDAIVQKVPELKKLADLREALTALKGPLGNMPAFRKALSDLVADEDKRAALLAEIDGGTAEI